MQLARSLFSVDLGVTVSRLSSLRCSPRVQFQLKGAKELMPRREGSFQPSSGSPKARRPGRDRRPIERFVPNPGLGGRSSGGEAETGEGPPSPGGSLLPDDVFVDLLERAKSPP